MNHLADRNNLFPIWSEEYSICWNNLWLWYVNLDGPLKHTDFCIYVFIYMYIISIYIWEIYMYIYIYYIYFADNYIKSHGTIILIIKVLDLDQPFSLYFSLIIFF